MNCKYCDGNLYMVFKPFKNPAHKSKRDPKYAFHIEARCADCHKFNGFLAQTEKLMESLKDNVLMKLDLEERSMPKKQKKCICGLFPSDSCPACR